VLFMQLLTTARGQCHTPADTKVLIQPLEAQN